MSACGRRQAGISRQTQSLLPIVVPPLLMKPSLTNADECRLVNTKWSDKVEEGHAFIQPPAPPHHSAAAFRRTNITALTHFAMYCCELARGDEAHIKKKKQ